MEARVLDEELRNVYPSAFEANSSRSASQTRTMFSAAELPTSVIASTLSHLTFLFPPTLALVPRSLVVSETIVMVAKFHRRLCFLNPDYGDAWLKDFAFYQSYTGHQPWNWSNKCSGQLYCPKDQTQSLTVIKMIFISSEGTVVSFSLRGRKKRVHYAKLQLKELEREYTNTKFITKEKRRRIAFSTNPSQKQLTIWFQNRRVKDKKRPEILKC
uniref:Homeobox D13a n=1 Tax=Cyprinus carpio carpio TaxID=630221 RepID=A0A9J7YAS5_CYPCA